MADQKMQESMQGGKQISEQAGEGAKTAARTGKSAIKKAKTAKKGAAAAKTTLLNPKVLLVIVIIVLIIILIAVVANSQSPSMQPAEYLTPIDEDQLNEPDEEEFEKAIHDIEESQAQFERLLEIIHEKKREEYEEVRAHGLEDLFKSENLAAQGIDLEASRNNMTEELVKARTPNRRDAETGITQMRHNQAAISGSPALANITASDEEKMTWVYLRQLGLTEAGTAGVMGNMKHESAGFHPNMVEGGNTSLTTKRELCRYAEKTLKKEGNSQYQGTDGRCYPGIGLVQWTATRAQNLIKFASQNDGSWTDITIQLNFLNYELTDGNYGKVLEKLKKEDNVDKATAYFMENFEGIDDGTDKLRKKYAKDYYEKFTGLEVNDIVLDKTYAVGDSKVTMQDFDILSAYSVSIANTQLYKENGEYVDVKGRKIKTYWFGDNAGKINYERDLKNRINALEKDAGFYRMHYVQNEDGTPKVFETADGVKAIKPILQETELDEYSENVFGIVPDEPYVNASRENASTHSTNREVIYAMSDETLSLLYDGDLDQINSDFSLRDSIGGGGAHYEGGAEYQSATPKQKAIVDAATAYSDPVNQGYPGLCEGFVAQAMRSAGVSYPGHCCASASREANARKTGEIPVGAAIYSDPSTWRYREIDSCGRECGHVAIYIGDGKVHGAQTPGTMSLEAYISYFGYGGWWLEGY